MEKYAAISIGIDLVLSRLSRFLFLVRRGDVSDLSNTRCNRLCNISPLGLCGDLNVNVVSERRWLNLFKIFIPTNYNKTELLIDEVISLIQIFIEIF